MLAASALDPALSAGLAAISAMVCVVPPQAPSGASLGSSGAVGVPVRSLVTQPVLALVLPIRLLPCDVALPVTSVPTGAVLAATIVLPMFSVPVDSMATPPAEARPVLVEIVQLVSVAIPASSSAPPAVPATLPANVELTALSNP